jgi:two-component system chemotaxis response regulator CheY
MRCLVVDDDEIHQIVLTEILRDSFHCDLANNGLEAVEMFRAAFSSDSRYDLICMDVTMPVCNGHEALSNIRSLEKQYNIPAHKQAKIVMVSGSDDAKNIVTSYCMGGTSYIVKPVQAKILTQLLKKHNLMT